MRVEREPECSPREAVIRWAQDRLADPGTVYLDTETTGLDEGAEIIELAVLDGVGQPLIDTLIQPRFWIPAVASDLHGITNEMVREAPTWRAIAPTVRELLEAASAVVVYNAAYDRRLVEQTSQLYHLPAPTASWMCAMEQYARFAGEWDPSRQRYRWHSLQAAAEALGCDTATVHRAQVDAALSRCIVWSIAALSVRDNRENERTDG